MRVNFYELLAKMNFDYVEEYKKLWILFMAENCVPVNGYLNTVFKYVESTYFRKLPFRGSFTSLDEMMNAVGLRNYVKSINDLFLLCEFLIAVLPDEETQKCPRLETQRKTIMGNIEYILERTNHVLHCDTSGNCIIVEKNKKANLASQLVDGPVIAFELIEYNHFAVKGNLESKKKLLFSIGAYIEPILKSKVLQQKGYKQLESDAGFLLNNFHIRHNNKVGAKAQEYITTVTDAELEEWYDKAYEVALSVIIINDYLSVGKDIADIKSQYAWKT